MEQTRPFAPQAAALGLFESLIVEPDHVLVAAPPLIVQVRRGTMSLDVLDRIERRAREARLRFTRSGGRIGFVGVLEESAAVMSEEVRVRQRAVLEGAIAGLDTRIAVLVGGSGLTATLQRTLARGLLIADRRVSVVKAADGAAAWIAPHLGVRPVEVASVVERARGLR